jgi:hypothetical protein
MHPDDQDPKLTTSRGADDPHEEKRADHEPGRAPNYESAAERQGDTNRESRVGPERERRDEERSSSPRESERTQPGPTER